MTKQKEGMTTIDGKEVLDMPFWVRHFLRHVAKRCLGLIVGWIDNYAIGKKKDN